MDRPSAEDTHEIALAELLSINRWRMSLASKMADTSTSLESFFPPLPGKQKQYLCCRDEHPCSKQVSIFL